MGSAFVREERAGGTRNGQPPSTRSLPPTSQPAGARSHDIDPYHIMGPTHAKTDISYT